MEHNPGAWRLDDNTIARLLTREDLASHWIFGRQMTVNPGEAAMWMQDGQVVKVVTEGAKVVSGVMDRLKGLFFAGGNLTVMMMDINDLAFHFPMGVDKEAVLADDPSFYGQLLEAYGKAASQAKAPAADAQAKAAREERLNHLVQDYSQALDEELQKRQAILTKDRESVAFDVRLTLVLAPERGVNLFKMFGAKNALDRSHIASLARRRLESAIFVPWISRHTAQELRQDLAILAGINKAAKQDMAAWLPELGMELKRLAINPALTGEERKAIIYREKQSLSSAAVDRHQHDLEDLQRDFDRLVMREKLAAQLTQAQADKDEEKQKIIQAAFLTDQKKKLSAAQMSDRIERIRLGTRLEAQKKLKELEALGIKRKWEMEKERMAAEAELEMDKMRVLAKEYRKNKGLKAQHKMQEMELRQQEAAKERDHVERLLEIGVREGALTDTLLVEAIRQQSVRKALDQGESVGRAFGEAQSRRDEGQRALPAQPAVSITSQGPMLVEAGSVAGQEAPQQKALPELPPPKSASEDDQTVITICPDCGEPVPEGSSFCGMCGTRLGE